MDHTFLAFGHNDSLVICKLKSIIHNQLESKKKRENLLLAITNNVKYMATLNEHVQDELKGTKEALRKTVEKNDELVTENYSLMQLNYGLEEDAKTLGEKKAEIVKLDTENKSKKESIDKLQVMLDDSTDRIEKINLELTIVTSEKMVLKKEHDSLTFDHRRLGREFKE